MKKAAKFVFPILLILACTDVHIWQHALLGIEYLPYLPNEVFLPLIITTPLLLVLVFFTTFLAAKRVGTGKAVALSFLSVAVTLAIVVGTGLHYGSYVARRYSGYLPLPILPDSPNGIVTMVVTVLLVCQLSALLILRLVTEKARPGRIVFAVAVWTILNGLLFLITT